jgi:large subunit ribosomal protein L13
MKTFSAKAEQVERKWFVIDADNQVVGRVAEKAAVLLRGKHKAIFTAHVDTGDHVIVINADKAVFTGKKEVQKEYMSYSGYIGGHHTESAKSRRARHPELIIEGAVKGMVPHNRLGRAVLRKLHVYKGADHPHAAQGATALKLK